MYRRHAGPAPASAGTIAGSNRGEYSRPSAASTPSSPAYASCWGSISCPPAGGLDAASIAALVGVGAIALAGIFSVWGLGALWGVIGFFSSGD